MKIKIKSDTNILKKHIENLKKELYNKQKELLEFKDFFHIFDEKNKDIIEFNKEIKILNNSLEKKMYKYKLVKNQ